MNNCQHITIAACVGFTNRGSEALLKTRVQAIKKLCPKSTFSVLTVYKQSCTPLPDVEYLQVFGMFADKSNKLRLLVQVFRTLWHFSFWTLSALSYRWTGKVFGKKLRAISGSQLFVSTDGDVLGEDYGLLPFVWRLYFLSIGLIMRKPVVIYSEGIGPFHSRPAKWLAKRFFNKCTYISVRDKISATHLRSLGIKKTIDVVPDSAFLLETSPREDLNYSDPGKRLIGIAVSKLAAAYGFKYKTATDSYHGFLEFMGELIDWLVTVHDANILLIPHVVETARDDYDTARDIKKHVTQDPARVRIVNNTFATPLNASELKKCISHCDLVIASRMHAAIGALSSQVPVIGIAYSHKMHGVLELVGIDQVIDIAALDWNITAMINDTLAASPKIKAALASQRLIIQDRAERPAKKVAEILAAQQSTDSRVKSLFVQHSPG